MSIGMLLTVSGVLTAITMLIFSAALFILIQTGSMGVRALFDRFMGGGANKDKDKKGTPDASGQQVRPKVSSGDVLRQRAQQLDFAPQVAAQGFNAQSAPQQATFTSHDPLSYPPPNQQFTQQPQQAQFGQSNPAMPSLSSARPFQAGQQPLGGNQYPQQPYSQQPLGSQPQQPLGGQQPYGQQSLGSQRPSANQYPQQPLGGQQSPGGQPQQPLSGQRPLGGNQYTPQPYGQQPSGNQPQQPLGGQAQQGPLGQYTPPLRSSANFDQNTAPGLRRRRDSRKGDDRDPIYDDGGGLSDYIGDIGDILG